MKTYLLSALIFHSSFNLTSHTFEDEGYFAVHDIDCRHFAFHASLRSAEYEKTVALKLLIIIHNYANIWPIIQSKSLLDRHWTALEAR